MQKKVKPYAKAIVHLLKGVVEKKGDNDSVWNSILRYHIEISDYINQIGLELIIKQDDHYAFVKQFEIDAEGNTIGLVSRRKMGYEVSIFLVILREIIKEFDENPNELNTEKYIFHNDLKEKIELFLPEQYDKHRFFKKLDSNIKRIIELGYLKEISEEQGETQYKIHKIIKEKITLDTLKEFKENLENYVQTLQNKL